MRIKIKPIFINYWAQFSLLEKTDKFSLIPKNDKRIFYIYPLIIAFCVGFFGIITDYFINIISVTISIIGALLLNVLLLLISEIKQNKSDESDRAQLINQTIDVTLYTITISFLLLLFICFTSYLNEEAIKSLVKTIISVFCYDKIEAFLSVCYNCISVIYSIIKRVIVYLYSVSIIFLLIHIFINIFLLIMRIEAFYKYEQKK